MPSQYSPSLPKMEYNERNERGSSRFSLGHIFGDPFALATISISILAWLIAFVSSIISIKQQPNGFPNFAWWALVYMFFCIIGITITVATDSEQTYHVAIVGFVGAGLVNTTSAVNSLIYSSSGAKEAAAAGFILLSMVAIIWIFYYGSQPNSSTRTYVDSFSLHKDARSQHMSSRTSRAGPGNAFTSRPETTVTSAAPQMYTSAQLGNNFETASPISGFPGNNNLRASTQPQTFTAGAAGATTEENAAPSEYPYKAKAIYSYEANPDDANEISFSKHEILEVSDVSGRWWQARKENGETGIAPSNYLILL